MKKLTKAILVTSLALAAGCVSVPKVDNAPVAALDLNRYLGEWYEIARFDHSFERGYDTDKLIWVRQDK
jgi:apolipoprotein D and lipocalin family protein